MIQAVLDGREQGCVVWHGCYNSSWQRILSPISFGHPAKMAHGLLRRIIEHGLEQGYWSKDSIIADPFGGIGTTGLMCSYYGIRSISVELEPRFYGYAVGFECDGVIGKDGHAACGAGPGEYESLFGGPPVAGQVHPPHHVLGNFEIHRPAWERRGLPLPVMLLGDSRHFAEIISCPGRVNAAITSPPYAEGLANAAEYRNPERARVDANRDIMRAKAGKAADAQYGLTPGQIGRLPAGQVDSVVTSPPFNLPMSQEHNGSRDGSRGTTPSEAGAFVKYGKTPGQIEGLPQGELSAVVTSPPFLGAREGTTKSVPTSGGGPCAERIRSVGTDGDCMGNTPGQIANLRSGDLDAAIMSPPYAESIGNENGIDYSKARGPKDGLKPSMARAALGGPYSADPQNIGNLKEGSIQGVITSPPYAEGGGHKTGKPERDIEHGKGIYTPCDGYGQTEGQIGNLAGGSVDGMVTSPPYASSTQVNNSPDDMTAGKARWAGGVDSAARVKQDYADMNTPGQIANSTGPTYWSEMKIVYEQMRLALKPGGVACVVLKSYVKAGKIVDLPGDTLQLLVALGFEPLERVRAMLVKETTENTLFEGEVTRKSERKSFFRRNCETQAKARRYWASVENQGSWVLLARERKGPKAKESHILQEAQKLAYEAAGKPEIDIETAINFEEILFVQAPGGAPLSEYRLEEVKD